MKTNGNIILEELRANIDEVFTHFVPLRFYIQTQMAYYNCHAVAPSVAYCLEGSKIVTADVKGRNFKGGYSSHSWVEKDGYVVDATHKLIVPTEVYRTLRLVKNEKLRTFKGFKKKNPNWIKGVFNTKEKIQDLPDELVLYLAFLYQKVQALTTTKDIKEFLTENLMKSYKKDAIIIRNANKYPVALMDDAYLDLAKKQYPNSYLFNESNVKVTEEDIHCFAVYN